MVARGHINGMNKFLKAIIGKLFTKIRWVKDNLSLKEQGGWN